MKQHDQVFSCLLIDCSIAFNITFNDKKGFEDNKVCRNKNFKEVLCKFEIKICLLIQPSTKCCQQISESK